MAPWYLRHLVCIMVCAQIAATELNYCLATKHYNTIDDALYGYPADIFDNSLINKLNQSNQLSEKTFKCPVDTYGINATFYCSNETKCPVHQQNVDTFLNFSRIFTPNNQRLSFCRFHHAMKNNLSEVNVFFSGGSMTVGAGTFSCKCFTEIDPRCKFVTYSDVMNLREDHKCTWGERLSGWIQRNSNAKVNTYFLGGSGVTTRGISTNFEVSMHSIKPDHIFTSSDIIFLDHSHNDNSGPHDWEHLDDEVSEGLELLLYKILSNSELHNWPTIILQSTYALGTEQGPELYKSFAIKHNLTMWSYRDVANSYYALNSQKEYRPYMSFQVGGIHPVWFMHNFIGDLTSNGLQERFNHCKENNGLIAYDHEKDSMVIDKNRFNFLKSCHRAQKNCKLKVIPLLYMVPFDIIRNSTDKIGTYESDPRNSWTLRLDDHNHPAGWIDYDAYTLSSISNNSKVYEKYKSNLTFQLNSPMNIEKEYLLSIEFLQTYKNAGAVDVYLCGTFFKSLDAFRPHSNVSVPFIKSITIAAFHHFGICLNEDKTGLIDKQWIEFRRLTKAPALSMDDVHSRGNQKFKLMSVFICEAARF